MLLELNLKAREEREGIGSRARKAREHFVVVQPADLARSLFHHRRAERDLAISCHYHRAAALHAQYGRGANTTPVGEVKGNRCDDVRHPWVTDGAP